MSRKNSIRKIFFACFLLWSLVVLGKGSNLGNNWTGRLRQIQETPCDKIQSLSPDITKDFLLINIWPKTGIEIDFTLYQYYLVDTNNVDPPLELTTVSGDETKKDIWGYYFPSNTPIPSGTISFNLKFVLKSASNDEYLCEAVKFEIKETPTDIVTFKNCNAEKTTCWTGEDTITMSRPFTMPSLVMVSRPTIEQPFVIKEISSAEDTDKFTYLINEEGVCKFFIYSNLLLVHSQNIEFISKPIIDLLRPFFIIDQDSKVNFKSDKEIKVAYLNDENKIVVSKNDQGVPDSYYFIIPVVPPTGKYTYQLEYMSLKFDMPEIIILTTNELMTFTGCNLNSKEFTFTLYSEINTGIAAKLYFNSIEVEGITFVAESNNIFKIQDTSTLNGPYEIMLFYKDETEAFSKARVTFTSYSNLKATYFLTSKIELLDVKCELSSVKLKMISDSKEYEFPTVSYTEEKLTCLLGEIDTLLIGEYNLVVDGKENTEQKITIVSIETLEFEVIVGEIEYTKTNTIKISLNNNELDYQTIVITSIDIINSKGEAYKLTKDNVNEEMKFTIQEDNKSLIWTKTFQYDDVFQIVTLRIGTRDKKNINKRIGEPVFSLVKNWGMYPSNPPLTKLKGEIQVLFAVEQVADLYINQILVNKDSLIGCTKETPVIKCPYEFPITEGPQNTYVIEVKLSNDWKTDGKNYDLYSYKFTDTCSTLGTPDETKKVELEIFRNPESLYIFKAEIYKDESYFKGTVNEQKIEWNLSEGEYSKLEVERIMDGDESTKMENFFEINVCILSKKEIDTINDIYAPSQQTLSLHFITPITKSDVSKVTLSNEANTIEIVFDDCIPIEMENTPIQNVECSKKPIETTSALIELELSWENKCMGKIVHLPKLTSKYNSIDLVNPKVLILAKEPKDNIKLTFKQELINKPKITLVHQKEVPVDMPLKDEDFAFDIPDKQISIVIDTIKAAIVEEGTYKIKVFDGETLLDESCTFLVSQSSNTFAYEHKTITKDRPVNGLEITFKEVEYVARVGTISLVKGDVIIANDITFTSKEGEPKTIILAVTGENADLQFAEEGKYKLNFLEKDQASDAQPIELIIYVYDGTIAISELKSRLFVYEDKTIDISFTLPLNDLAIISKIQVQGSEPPIYFDIGIKEEKNKMNFILSFREMNDGFGKYNGISFLNCTDHELFSIKESIVLIKQEELPSSVKEKVIRMDELEQFMVEFDKKIYKEYEKDFSIRSEDVESCTNEVIEEEGVEGALNKLKVECTFRQKKNNHFLSIFLKKIQLTQDNDFQVLRCKDGEYWSDGAQKCINCSEEYKIYDKDTFICKECSELDTNIPNFEMNEEGIGTCVVNCSDLNGLYNKVCYSKCPNDADNKVQYIEDKMCVTTCSLGKGVENSTRCVAFKITGVDKNLYEKTNEQKFTIKLNSEDIAPAITSFKLDKTSHESISVSFGSDCKISDLKKDEYNCKTNSLATVEADAYKLKWLIGEEKIDDSGFDVNINSYIKLTAVSPLIVDLKKEEVVKLTYSGKFDEDEYNIKMYDINKVLEYDANEFITLIEEKDVSITFKSDFKYKGSFNFYTYGPYNYEDKAFDATLIINKNAFEIVNSLLEIKEYTKYDTIEIETKEPIQMNQIKSIHYKHPTVESVPVPNYTVESNMLKLQFKVTCDTIGDYIFTIEEISGGISNYTIRRNPGTITLDSPVFYYKVDGPPASTIINFDGFLDDNILNEPVIVKDSKFNLIMEPIPDSDNKKFAISLKELPDEYKWDKYMGLDFYRKNDGEANSFVIFSFEHNIIIVDEKTIPFDPKIENNSVYVDKDAKSFILEFNQIIYNEYFDEKNPKILIMTQDFGCKLSFDENKTNEINVIECNSPIPNNTKFSLKSFDKDITFTILDKCEVPKVINPKNQCSLCKDLDEALPFYYDHSCHKECPSNVILNQDFVCYDKCDSIPDNTDKPYLKDNKCVSSCDDYYTYEKEKKCYQTCPSTLFIIVDNKTCVESCPDGKYPNNKRECSSDCLIIDHNGNCLSECPQGTIFDKTTKKCIYLPQDPSDTNCDFCKNGSCEITDKRKRCICNDNYYGLNCDSAFSSPDDKKIVVDSLISTLCDENNKLNLDMKDSTMINNALTLTEMIDQNNDIINDFDEQHIFDISSNIDQILHKGTEGIDYNETSVIPFIDLALTTSITKIKYIRNNLRLLQDDSKWMSLLQDGISRLIISLKNYFSNLPKTYGYDKTLFKFIQDQVGLFRVLIWTNNKESMEKYEKIVQDSNMTIINTEMLTEQDGVSSYTIVNIEQSPEIQTALDGNQLQSGGILFSIFDNDKKTELNQATSLVKPHFYMKMIESLNDTTYDYYIQRNVDIYNQNDPAFTESCYFNKKLDYDLPQVYRKCMLFQNKTIVPSVGCEYLGFSEVYNKITLECSLSSPAVSFTVTETTLPDSNDEIDVLGTKCGAYVQNIESNFGFWTFLVALVIGIIALIVMQIVDNTKIPVDRVDKWLALDDLIIPNSHANQSCSQIQIVKNVDDVQIYSHQQHKTSNIYGKNFLRLHPVISLFYESVITPLPFKIYLFVFNTLNLFGFNAILYSEKMIENKIYDDMRDNFVYPMKGEFAKIICSIIITIGLTMIIRLIVLITKNDKEALIKKIGELATNDEKYKACKDFWRKGFVRRLVGYIIMLGLIVFLFYYSVVFCGMYVLTQYGWFYSGIWSLIFNWVVFAPVSILLISSIESANCASGCIHYTKQLFWF